jgi:hypothetical protein
MGSLHEVNMYSEEDIVRVGPHRLLCADITIDEAIDVLMRGRKADVIYSDPPWGPGNQQYWHTMRERGSRPRTEWHAFLNAFSELCANHRTPSAPVFVEMGLRWTDDLDRAMNAVGLPLMNRWAIYYGPKAKPLPNTVAVYGAPPPVFELPDPPHGEPVTRAILSAAIRPGDIVLDPCTGLGMTARCTVRSGGIFMGGEMNSKRLGKTESWMRKHI